MTFIGKDLNDIKELHFDQTSYDPRGETTSENKQLLNGNAVFKDIAVVCALNNKAKIFHDDGKFNKQGEPTEAALKVAAEKLGRYDERLGKADYAKDPTPYAAMLSQTIKPVATLDFTSDRKTMSTVVRGFNGDMNSVLLKGAPERVIEKCESYKTADGRVAKLTAEDKHKLINECRQYAS